MTSAAASAGGDGGGHVEEPIAAPFSPSKSLASSLQDGAEPNEIIKAGSVSPRGRYPSVAEIGRDPSGIAEGADSVIAEEEENVVAKSIMSHDQAAWMAMTQPSLTRPSPVRYVNRDQQQDGDDDENEHCHVGKVEIGGIGMQGSWNFEARDEVDDEGSGAGAPSPTGTDDAVLSPVATYSTNKEREPSPFFSRDVNAVEGYFKKLLSVGIQLLLNDPPTSSESDVPRLNRSGKMFLQFGTTARSDGLGKFEDPRLLWTDGQDVSYTLELLDIQSIRQPSPLELDISYPFAIPAHSFFLTTTNNIISNDVNKSNSNESDAHFGHTSLLFEAVDELQMTRVTTALRGIIGKLAKKIILGENDWVVQMMSASSVPGGRAVMSDTLDDLEGSSVVPRAMADVTDHLVKKTTLMKRAQERRSKLRSKTRHVLL